MSVNRMLVVWSIVGAILVGLAIPWFLWGVDQVVAGLPVWIWWHIVWMIVAAILFRIFVKRAWGIGVRCSGDQR
ncbi:DUF3311 domain-containing protein [Salinarchaeum sp. IM2453]|uniref:DUF3311 domain-containing protein n=1 Tax=Salinarchaeum sp. IM2453 TaxID=2862870 RepID=UPI001C831160|nr:DUF3311 domain-containing protein [Salinarchaeum sp. IM2453]QZA88299.1 DUF3311 domain-containing protein [Salinarchaeum sp. IM2453]